MTNPSDLGGSGLTSTRIEQVLAREVFDSRGKPTVEVEVHCAGGQSGSAIVPSGASTGRLEAHELRDANSPRLDGLGVRQAVEHVRAVIAPAVRGMNAADQAALDARLCELDGSPSKSRLGANAVLGVSLAVPRAAAAARGVPLVEHLQDLWQSAGGAGTRCVLPLPMINMISGGLHAGRNLDLQDFLIIPVGAGSFREALDWTVSVYRRLGAILSAAGLEGTLVGDEGGYGPRLANHEQAARLILEAIAAAGLEPGRDVALALDVASTHFFRDGTYTLAAENRTLNRQGMVDLLAAWVNQYPIVSIEDGAAEDDWAGWKLLTERLGARVQLIGDDLFVTNAARLQRGIDERVANSVLIKVNQIGTLSETFATLRLAREAGYRPVISARSGETEDPLIADLAVATGAGQIKIGSVARSERLAKYNQLLRLEERLGDRADWLGGRVLRASPMNS